MAAEEGGTMEMIISAIAFLVPWIIALSVGAVFFICWMLMIEIIVVIVNVIGAICSGVGGLLSKW